MLLADGDTVKRARQETRNKQCKNDNATIDGNLVWLSLFVARASCALLRQTWLFSERRLLQCNNAGCQCDAKMVQKAMLKVVVKVMLNARPRETLSLLRLARCMMHDAGHFLLQSVSRQQHVLDHIAIDVMSFQILNRADCIEFGLYIKSASNDLFLSHIE